MNFMKELSLNDTVVIHENFSEESTIFSITKEDKTCFALQLNWKHSTSVSLLSRYILRIEIKIILNTIK
jgi:hypothetical protein